MGSGPGLQYPTIGAVFGGTDMQLLRTTPHWADVMLPGGTAGWVARPYTLPAGQLTAAGNALVVHALFITVTAPVLNLRSGPGQDHQVVAEIAQGTKLQVLALTTHWAQVALPASSIDGWVLRSLTT